MHHPPHAGPERAISFARTHSIERKWFQTCFQKHLFHRKTFCDGNGNPGTCQLVHLSFRHRYMVMRYSPAIHDARHLIKNFLGNAGQLLGNNMLPPADCLVLNYHGTQKKFIRNFEYQLKWLNDHFHIGTPRDLFDYYERKKTGDRTMVVLTFDDGIKNNLYAVEAMARSGIKAFFFVVPGFIETASQKDFFLRNIRPVINPEIDSAKEDFEALSWHELMGLSKEGHHIGSHTSTHTLVAGSGDASHEIEDSKTAIENAISTRVSTFCSPNNT